MGSVVVGIGEALWDMFPDGKAIGGAPANFAFHVSQFGIDSCAVSAIGKDKLGDEIVEIFDDSGLEHILERVDYPTGTVRVDLDAEGIPSYTITEGVAWDNLPFTERIRLLASSCRAVCFGSLAQRSDVTASTVCSFIEAMPEDSMKVFDINLRQHFYTRGIISRSMKYADVLKVNDEEVMVLGSMLEYGDPDMKSIARRLMEEFGLTIVVLTCGADCSYVFTRSKESYIPTPKVDVVSTVGAGDSFTAAFVAALLRGKDIREAHQLAVSVSAFVCTRKEAMPLLPETMKSL
jgi:fructokinase